VSRPPHEVRRYYASFSYQAASWNKARRVVAKVEWHPGELYPRVGFIVTNMTRPAERVVMFYNHRGAAEQHIKEGKIAITWTRLSCHRFAATVALLALSSLLAGGGYDPSVSEVHDAIKHLLAASRQIGSIEWALPELGELAERQCAPGREPFQHAIQPALSRWHPGEPSV
jgi:hypothetical protein